MTIRRVDPDEASKLLGEGWTYLDVRSVAEFVQGHPTGAYNVPLLDQVPGHGLRPNPDFVAEVKAVFETKRRLVVGCKAGGRSVAAARMLAEAGYGEIVDMRGGFSGEMESAGRVSCAGWASRGLPVSTQAEPGRSYSDLKARKR